MPAGVRYLERYNRSTILQTSLTVGHVYEFHMSPKYFQRQKPHLESHCLSARKKFCELSNV